MTHEQLKFRNTIGEAAKAFYNEYKILPSLVVAMAIKESNWGKSQLSAKNHNYFGMKWNTKCGTKYVELPTKEYVNGKYVTVNAKFRAYDTLTEGIEGFYKFITGYKRYNNLIGEMDPREACIKVQKDGWATAPNYGISLYNDYVVKYDLTVFNRVGDTVHDPVEDPSGAYEVGKVYVTDVNLNIRHYPNGAKKKMYELTVSGKMNSYQDANGNAVLRAGTRVTCMDTVTMGHSIWMLIPSGYICAVNDGKVYIK